MVRVSAIVLASVLLAGCASVPARWEKPGATNTDYERDGRTCTEEGGTVTGQGTDSWWRGILLDVGIVRGQADADRSWVKCMEAKGWRPAKP